MNHCLLARVMRRPKLGRDTLWLASSDGFAIIFGLLGQIILAKALLKSDYGLLVVIIDAFATMYILIDAGLPTLLGRDGPRAPGRAREAAHRILKLQLIIAIPFIIGSLIFSYFIWDDVPFGLLEACAIVAIGHIMSYPHRSLLRALGEARIESLIKFSERAITTTLYAVLLWQGADDPRTYAIAFAAGVIIALIISLWQGEKVGKLAIGEGELPSEWDTNKSLVIAALPFAVTLGILPYVTKLEKFLLAGLGNYDDVSIYHVAQLAWIAGLMLPQAMRAALLPYLGEVRDDEEEFSHRMLKAHHITIALVPIGLLTGFLVVNFSIPQFFGDEYLDSIPVFEILLAGWAMTLLSVPWYVALQAGKKPWMFTLLLFLVVLTAGLTGWYLIPKVGVMGAAWASLIGTSVMLSASKLICLDKDHLTDAIALLCVITCYQLSIDSWYALVGLFTVIPAAQSIAYLRSLPRNDQEE